jgi:hypothetical protein
VQNRGEGAENDYRSGMSSLMGLGGDEIRSETNDIVNRYVKLRKQNPAQAAAYLREAGRVLDARHPVSFRRALMSNYGRAVGLEEGKPPYEAIGEGGTRADQARELDLFGFKHTPDAALAWELPMAGVGLYGGHRLQRWAANRQQTYQALRGELPLGPGKTQFDAWKNELSKGQQASLQNWRSAGGRGPRLSFGVPGTRWRPFSRGIAAGPGGEPISRQDIGNLYKQMAGAKPGRTGMGTGAQMAWTAAWMAPYLYRLWQSEWGQGGSRHPSSTVNRLSELASPEK